MKAVITGISGFIGGALGRRLQGAGWLVTGLGRRDPGLPDVPFSKGTLGEPAEPGVFRDTALVLHAAHDMGSGPHVRNVEGTKIWFAQARTEGAARQVFLSSVSAHARAPSRYGRSKWVLERFFVENGEIVLRPGLVAGRGGSFGRLAAFLERHRVAPVPGGPALRTTLTDLDALATVLLRVATLASGSVHNVFEPETVTLVDLARLIRRAQSSRGWVVALPSALSSALLRSAAAAGIPLSFDHEMLLALRQSAGYGYRSSYAELGIAPKALRRLVEESLTR
jgi:nucleoside-diphosphate-sugar epimerase